MTKLNCYCALLFLTFAGSVRAGAVTVEGCWTMIESYPSVEFRIVNNSSSDLTLDNTEFPWNGNGAIIVAYRGDRVVGKVLDRIYPIQDDEARLVTLRRGESRAGSVVLSEYFRGSDDAKSVARVKLLWSYSLELGRDETLEFGGSVNFGSPAQKCSNAQKKYGE